MNRLMTHPIIALKDLVSDAEATRIAFVQSGNPETALYWFRIKRDLEIAIEILKFMERPVDVQVKDIRPSALWRGSFTEAAKQTIHTILEHATNADTEETIKFKLVEPVIEET